MNALQEDSAIMDHEEQRNAHQAPSMISAKPRTSSIALLAFQATIVLEAAHPLPLENAAQATTAQQVQQTLRCTHHPLEPILKKERQWQHFVITELTIPLLLRQHVFLAELASTAMNKVTNS